jgi:hypothetical protein
MLIVKYEKQGWKAYSLSQGNYIVFVCLPLPSELTQDQQRRKRRLPAKPGKIWQVTSHLTLIGWVLSFLPSVDGLLKWGRARVVRVANNVACRALRLCFSSHKQGRLFRSLRSTDAVGAFLARLTGGC